MIEDHTPSEFLWILQFFANYSFGHHISQLLIRWTILKNHRLFCHQISNKMEFNIHMLCSSMEHWVFGKAIQDLLSQYLYKGSSYFIPHSSIIFFNQIPWQQAALYVIYSTLFEDNATISCFFDSQLTALDPKLKQHQLYFSCPLDLIPSHYMKIFTAWIFLIYHIEFHNSFYLLNTSTNV